MNVRDMAFAFWRRLPAAPRQKMAHAIFERMRPELDNISPDEVAGRNVPKIVVGFLSSPSGLGQSARLTARALSTAGHSVYGIDLSRYFYEGAGTINHSLPDGAQIQGPAHLIISINAPYLAYALSVLGRSFLRQKYVTGYWAWELSKLPDSWKKGFSSVHDVIVPSSFVASAVRDMQVSCPVRVAPHPVVFDLPPLSPFVAGKKRNDQPFSIVSVMNAGSGFERKNPLALIKAFKLAFGNDTGARLRLLITNAAHYPKGHSAILRAVDGVDNIEVNWNSLNRNELWKWWGTPDVYASLHRSEGFGLPLAEAMGAGIAVVATGWSGNMEFMSVDNSAPVDFTMVDVVDPQIKYAGDLGQWAEADTGHAAAIFQRLRKEPEIIKSLSRSGHKTVGINLSGDRFLENLFSLYSH